MQFISVIVRILFGENMHLNYNPKDGLVNRLLISLALLAVFLISTIRQFKRFLCLFIRDMKAAGIAEKIRLRASAGTFKSKRKTTFNIV